MSSSRILSSDSSRNGARKGSKRSMILLNEILRENLENPSNIDETEDPEKIVARAEELARENEKRFIGSKKSSRTIVSKREYAQSLHRQADHLHDKGDYEMALVLYHRAASACPRETSHGVAARRTAAAISLATNPSKTTRKILSREKNVAQLVGISCPETAAQRAKKIVEESADPVSTIDQILKYFDSRNFDFRDRPSHRSQLMISRSRTMLRQLSSMASQALEKLQVAYASADFKTSLKIGNELVLIAEPLIDRYRYEVAARHYLSMTQITLGRHDRAHDQVTRMIESAKKSNDTSLITRSYMTLGRVHLTFRHLDAAARAWQRLSRNIDDAVPRAWLFHEIGRCYFEMKRYDEALEMSSRCLEYADEGNSRKWLLHGKLLNGQALAELGRLGEAVLILKRARTIADTEKNNETRDYISELIDRINETLRRAVCLDEVSEHANSSFKNENKVKKKLQRAQSENVTCGKLSREFKSSREKLENIVTNSRLKSKIPKSRVKMLKSPKDLRRKNSRILMCKTKRKNMTKIVKSSMSLLTSEESEMFDNEIIANDNDDCTENSDESKNELLTSRTRVIEKKIVNDENFIDELIENNKFVVDEDHCSGDGEHTNRTGKTYVINESL